jgi:hypothetical protein
MLWQAGVDVAEWLSTKEVADALEVSESTVLRRFASPAVADQWWGSGGWREKPLSVRKVYQVRDAVVRRLAGRTGPATPEPSA